MVGKIIAIFILIAALAAMLVLYKTFSVPTHSADFAGVSLRLDYATTGAAREQGLSGRADVPDGYGMLFAFPESDYHGFWMKDMLVPVDILWLDEAGRAVSILSEVATSTYPHVFYPSAPARYVLETAAGFARSHMVATGTPLVVQDGLQTIPVVSE